MSALIVVNVRQTILYLVLDITLSSTQLFLSLKRGTCVVYKPNELTRRTLYNVGHYQAKYFVLVILESSGVCNI